MTAIMLPSKGNYETDLKIVCPHFTIFETILMLDDPNSDPQARGDPYCTLFVSRLSYDTNEHDLEREFGRFGPIERVFFPFRVSGLN